MILLIELFRSSVENCDGYFLTGPKPIKADPFGDGYRHALTGLDYSCLS